MLKRTTTIAGLLLALSLCTFATPTPPPCTITGPGPSNIARPSTVGDCTPSKAVPEPGSLLVFGTGLLLGVGFLRRKLGVR